MEHLQNFHQLNIGNPYARLRHQVNRIIADKPYSETESESDDQHIDTE